MSIFRQAAPNTGALSSSTATVTTSPIFCRSSPSASDLIHPKITLFSKRNTKFNPTNPRRQLRVRRHRHFSKDTECVYISGPKQSLSSSTATTEPVANDQPVLVGGDGVPLEGVIKFQKSISSSRLEKWGRVALLAGGDVLALVLFSAIGRLSYGFSVFDFETLRTADPFIAGILNPCRLVSRCIFSWGYDEDGRGMHGLSKAVIAAAKSWPIARPIGVSTRGITLGHYPPINFIWVTLGSTAVLLLGWRTLLFSFVSCDKGQKEDMYNQGIPFELFEGRRNFELMAF